MDEYNFQQQLQALQQRVLDLTMEYVPQRQQPAMRNMRHLEDAFYNQLDDVKARVVSMEASMGVHAQSMLHQQEGIRGSQHDRMDHNAIPSQQTHITLPSGPLFWQLFNSLRTDVRSIDSRVASLEQNVSDLEDRVDGLDPNRFTPPASATGSEMGYASAMNSQTNFKSAPVLHHELVPELYTSMNESQGCLPIPTDQTAPPSNSEWHAARFGVLNDPEGFPKRYDALGQHQSHREVDLATDVAKVASAVEQLRYQNTDIRNYVGRIDEENGKLMKAIHVLTQGLDHVLRLNNPAEAELPAISKGFDMPEGVVFRDREIARMDEQLRIAHERIGATEETIAQRDNLITQLRSEQDHYNPREQALKDQHRKEQLINYRNKLTAKDRQLYDLQDQIEDRNNALRRWEESWSKLEDSYRHANAKATAYEDHWHEHRFEKDEQIDRIVTEHEDEVKKLKEFCEQKDTVLHKQEDVIARGGKLLEERDAEIEAFQRRIRAADDDRENAVRTQERLSRILNDKVAKLAALNGASDFSRQKQSLPRPVELPGPAGEVSKKEEAGQNDLQPNAARAKYTPKPPSAPQPWVQIGESPLAFHKVEHGERGAYVWENDAQEAGHEAEKLDEVSPLSNDRRRGGRIGGRNRRHPYRYYPELEKQRPESLRSHDETTPGSIRPDDTVKRHEAMMKQMKGGGSAPSEQGRHPRDDKAFWPSLPAPVTARRMASEADLRSFSSNKNPGYSTRTLSKHQSLQELRKRRLQPYVETEGESGEERGREV